MTLTPYPISETARQTARASGFDIDNLDRRYPVQNPQMEQLIALRGRDPRAQQLLNARQGKARENVREHSS